EVVLDRATDAIAELRRIPRPDTVRVEELSDGSTRIRFRRRDGTEAVLVEGEFWHVMMPPLQDDLRGTSPILVDGREAVAVAIALQQYANRLFTNDATPPYIFTMDGNFKGSEDKKNWLTAWRRWTTGRNRHQPGIAEYGMKPH
ncbi:phage portal protein, partial [Roseivivax isoporae]|uniref:phage portal protein n=1 Tax=Roseivivax isoporae TaxID=591206 RepID=UPI0005C20FE7